MMRLPGRQLGDARCHGEQRRQCRFVAPAQVVRDAQADGGPWAAVEVDEDGSDGAHRGS
jgi:hypothetical protein